MCRKKEKVIGRRVTHYGVEVIETPKKNIVKPKPFITDIQYNKLLDDNKDRYDRLTPEEKTELIKNKRLHQILRCKKTGQLH